MRPSPGRVRAGHGGPAVRDHEGAGERCHPTVQPVNRVGDDYAAHGHDHDGATEVVGDVPMHLPERWPSATGGKGFEGEAQHPLARSQCGTLRGLAHASLLTTPSCSCEAFFSFVRCGSLNSFMLVNSTMPIGVSV